MIEEIKEDNNCIVKAFENCEISILHENIDNKKVYYFKASDIGKALGIVNIHSTIQNYEDEDERVIRKAYDPQKNLQNTTFLSSQGVYHLLYNSKKDIAKKFRKWAGNILDDIIFNESVELKRQLEENKQLLLEQKDQIKQLENKPELEGFIKKSGYIYIIIDTILTILKNTGHIKLGSCGDDKINTRLSQLNVGSSTGSLKLIQKFKTFDVKFVEEMVHSALEPLRIRNRKEWFYFSNKSQLDYIINTIEKCIEFTNQFNIKDFKHFEKILSLKNTNQQIKDVQDTNVEIEVVENAEDVIKNEDNIENVEVVDDVKYTGLTWTKSKNKWKSSLTYKQKNYHLGYFIDKVEAATVYNDYACYINETFKDQLRKSYRLNNIVNYIPNPRDIPEENKVIHQDNKTSKYHGVHFVQSRNNYNSSISINGRSMNIASGKTEIEAAKIYNQQALFYNMTKKTNYQLNEIDDYITEPKDVKTENINIKDSKKTSKYVGVIWDKNISRWKALLVFNKTTLYLGLYSDEIDAAKSYNQQALYINTKAKTKYKLNDIKNYITEAKNLYNEKYKDKLLNF